MRQLHTMVDDILKDMRSAFCWPSADTGRPSIAPQRLLRAHFCRSLNRALRALWIEQLNYNVLLRRFVGLDADRYGTMRLSAGAGSGC
jgi:hypothetical protein